jgi:4-amino-4-deoxy-L-arabinose transferase-like glycosyltransferase
MRGLRTVLVGCVLLAALAVRLGMGVYLGFNAPPDFHACGSDTVEFESLAWSMARGDGYRMSPDAPLTAFRAPGYPLALAALYRLFGRTYFVNRVALSLAGAATCWLVYLLALRSGLDWRTALFAALVAAFLPLQFYFCGHFMSEPLAGLLNTASCLLIAIGLAEGPPGSSPRPAWPWLLGGGVACGLSALVRPAGLPLPLALGGLLLVTRGVGPRRAAAWTLAVALGAAVAVAPWSVRNRLALGRNTLIATNGGSTFWGANNAVVAQAGNRKWGSWISTNFDRARKEREVLSLANEADRDRKEWQIGMDFLRSNPGRVPVLLLGKFWRLVTPFADSSNRVYVAAVAAGQVALLPAALAGLAIVLRRGDTRRRFLALNAELLTLAANTAVFYGSERFRAPYEPFLAVLAAVAAGRLLRWEKWEAGEGGTRK